MNQLCERSEKQSEHYSIESLAGMPWTDAERSSFKDMLDLSTATAATLEKKMTELGVEFFGGDGSTHQQAVEITGPHREDHFVGICLLLAHKIGAGSKFIKPGVPTKVNGEVFLHYTFVNKKELWIHAGKWILGNRCQGKDSPKCVDILPANEPEQLCADMKDSIICTLKPAYTPTLYTFIELYTSIYNAVQKGDKESTRLIVELGKAFGVSRAADLMNAFDIFQIKMSGGNGSLQQPIRIVGNIGSTQRQLIGHMIMNHIRPGKRLANKRMAKDNERTYEVFSFKGAPEVWIDITN
ncbi:hypothetical protein KBD59_04525 [Candidatus Gracilibacteria bacterium]|nr:hypothetical protein [Candidatus Gracilibacteria bacterium]